MKLDEKNNSNLLIILTIKKSNFSSLIDNINVNIHLQNPNFSETLLNSNIYTYVYIPSKDS